MNRTFALMIIAAISLLVLLFFLMAGTEPISKDSKIEIIVSILPQKEFVSAVGGDHVRVRELIPPGASPATYDPSPRDLMAIEDADIYFRVGYIPFEAAHLEAIQSTNPTLRVVDTSEGIKIRHVDEHGEHIGIDPHLWLSPRLVKQQVENIYSGLAEIDPANAAKYRANADTYIARLDELDRDLETAFSELDTDVLMVFHPAWGYLADDYGLMQISIENEGKDPSPGELQETIELALEKNVRVIFIQEQFDKSVAESVAEEIGAVVIQIDPLAEAYIQNMKSIGEVISAYLS
jgi:zinc transport system substrate-binding protein